MLPWVVVPVVAGLLLWLSWPPDAAAPQQPAALPSAALAPVGAADVCAAVMDRLEVQPAAMVPGNAGLAAGTAWSVRILVLDDIDEPVEGATVEVWAGEQQQLPVAEATCASAAWIGRAEGPPLLTATTAADGACSLRVARPRVYVAARHAGFGRSVVHGIDAGGSSGDRTVRVWLGHPVLVRGLVIAAEGRPVPFALVEAQLTAFGSTKPKEYCLSTGTVVADGCGRFRFEANVGTVMTVQAAAHGGKSMPLTVTATAGLDMVLVFAGGITVTGRVVDDVGAPIAGASLRVSPLDPLYFGYARHEWVQSQADGSFLLPLPTYAAFKVWATNVAPLLRSAAVEVQPTPLQPHPRIELQLSRPRPIRGSVCLADGSPAAGAEVVAALRDSGVEIQLVQGLRTTHADAAGAFELRTSSQSTWDLHATAAGGEGGQEAVAAGSDRVRIVLEAPLQQVVSGRVVVGSSDQPVPQYSLGWARSHAAGLREYRTVPRYAVGLDGGFVVQGIPRGEDWVLIAIADGFAPAVAGPFAPSTTNPFVVMRLPALSELPVRITDYRGGQPVRHLTLSAVGPLPVGPRLQDRLAPSDANGCCRLYLAPGRVTVVVRRSFEVMARREVDVVPGVNPEVVLQVQL